MNINNYLLKNYAYNDRVSLRFFRSNNKIHALKNYIRLDNYFKINYYKNGRIERLIVYEANNIDGGYYWSGTFHIPKYTVKCVVNKINDYSMLSFRCINMIKATIRRCC